MLDLDAVGGKSGQNSVSARVAYNRRRWDLEKDCLPIDDRMPFVCECANDGCLGILELTALEHEAGHMCPHWTAVLPGHVVQGDRSRTLVQHPHFWVVERDVD